jgi:hypothetical protein
MIRKCSCSSLLDNFMLHQRFAVVATADMPFAVQLQLELQRLRRPACMLDSAASTVACCSGMNNIMSQLYSRH